MKKSLLSITLITILNVFTLSSKSHSREGGINRRERESRDRQSMERLNRIELEALNVALREQLNQLTQELARHQSLFITMLAHQAAQERQEPVELRAPQSPEELQALQRRLIRQGVTLTIIPAPARGPAEENNTEEPAHQEPSQR